MSENVRVANEKVWEMPEMPKSTIVEVIFVRGFSTFNVTFD